MYSTALADWENVESVPEIRRTKTFYLTLLKILSKFIDVSNQNPTPFFINGFYLSQTVVSMEYFYYSEQLSFSKLTR